MIEFFNKFQINKSLLQLFRYGLVGFSSNLTAYFVYLLITNWGIEPKKAMTLVYVLGVFISFAGNRKWTFQHNGDNTRTIARYVVAHLSGYLLNWLILFSFVDFLGYAHQWVQAVAIFVVAGFLFVVFKHFVFITNGMLKK